MIAAAAEEITIMIVMMAQRTADKTNRLLFFTDKAESRRNFSGFFAGICRTYCENHAQVVQ